MEKLIKENCVIHSSPPTPICHNCKKEICFHKILTLPPFLINVIKFTVFCFLSLPLLTRSTSLVGWLLNDDKQSEVKLSSSINSLGNTLDTKDIFHFNISTSFLRFLKFCGFSDNNELFLILYFNFDYFSPGLQSFSSSL